MGNVLAPGAQGHLFCLDLMFRRWRASFCTAEKRVKNVEKNSERGKEKMSEVFDVEDQALLYTKRLALSNRDVR